jgi:hypothetical protein
VAGTAIEGKPQMLDIDLSPAVSFHLIDRSKKDTYMSFMFENLDVYQKAVSYAD